MIIMKVVILIMKCVKIMIMIFSNDIINEIIMIVMTIINVWIVMIK